MSQRNLIAAASLAAFALVLGAMAIVGAKWAAAPIPKYAPAATPEETCVPIEPEPVVVARRDVTVSVYNSGSRSGRARAVLTMLEEAGFKAGAIGNAPEGLATDRATIYYDPVDSPRADLVRRIIGPKTPIMPNTEDLGPGVAIVIGDDFGKLRKKAPRRITITPDTPECVDVASG